VLGRGGVAKDATSVVLNVTATDASAAGFVTVYPCGTTRPLASNLNIAAGQTVANLVVTGVGSKGAVCIYSQASVHVVADVGGSFTAAGRFTGLTPARLADTRPGQTTVDGRSLPGQILPAGATLTVRVTGRGDVSSAATTAVLNVTATNPQVAGYLTVYPCGIQRPLASNVNYVAGQTAPNAVISRVGADGEICVYSSQATDVIVDVTGYFA
jgi:hypothetical protein